MQRLLPLISRRHFSNGLSEAQRLRKISDDLCELLRVKEISDTLIIKDNEKLQQYLDRQPEVDPSIIKECYDLLKQGSGTGW